MSGRRPDPVPDAFTLRLGSRASQLALAQTRLVEAGLRAHVPSLRTEILTFETQGDRFLDRPLAEVGGKGLFVAEIERALLEGRVDVAVHSLKDMPGVLPEGLAIAAIPFREDARDVVVLPPDDGGSPGPGRRTKPADVASATLAVLPAGARVGTSSPRRVAQLKALRPDLRLEPVRGNVGTRLRKLDEGRFDALVLAGAGLRRLGLEHRISAWIPVEVVVPAVGQGALAVECRSRDARVRRLLTAIDDPLAHLAVAAERAFLAALGGSCQVPLCAHARLVAEDQIAIDGLVASPDGSEIIRAGLTGPALEGPDLGRRLADDLRARGADRLLERAG